MPSPTMPGRSIYQWMDGWRESELYVPLNNYNKVDCNISKLMEGITTR